ncbi:MAG TPA: glycosyltransferase [Pyrinomonadaceae bacterium]|nr:glycosyltransferase [Pyrinomonadaceae bacterium]
MRILFVATPESVHTARWIGQLGGQGWDVHLFPTNDAPPHAALTGVTFHAFSGARPSGADPGLRVKGPYPLRRGGYVLQLAARQVFPRRMARDARLASAVRRIRPDIVHSLGVQLAAYPTLEAKRAFGEGFPPWLVSSWGNDLYLLGRLAEHAPKIEAVLSACEYFTADCERDNALAREHGFRGETFPALPGAGGLDIELAKRLRTPGPTSARRVVALKGYQSWYGRALDGLRAVEMCADVLEGYTLVVYFANPDVAVAAELMSQRTGIKVELFPSGSYEESLRLHGRARVSVGVSISDGLPLSTVEAALMGSFPVQTDTSCVGERLRDGVGTLLVPPDDIGSIAAALRRALTDDELVDRAAGINFRQIAGTMSREAVTPRAVEMYEKIYAARRAEGGGGARHN